MCLLLVYLEKCRADGRSCHLFASWVPFKALYRESPAERPNSPVPSLASFGTVLKGQKIFVEE